MSTFDDREKAFESKFTYDAETKFKIEARRDKKAAQWAAELLGISAEDYTKELIKADLEFEGPEDVIAKLVKDLEGKASEQDIREKIAHFETEARDEVTAGS